MNDFFFLQQSVSVSRNASLPVGQWFVAVLMELLIIEEQGLIEKINISWICNELHVEQQACYKLALRPHTHTFMHINIHKLENI